MTTAAGTAMRTTWFAAPPDLAGMAHCRQPSRTCAGRRLDAQPICLQRGQMRATGNQGAVASGPGKAATDHSTVAPAPKTTYLSRFADMLSMDRRG